MLVHRSLLRVASLVCGEHARQRTFDPLVADWQQEWRDARGARKVWAAVSGGSAFLGSLVRCAGVEHLAQRTPTTGFLLILTLLAVSAVALQLQPLQFSWRHWAWDQFHFRLSIPRADSVWLLPGRAAFGVMVAILPASLLAARYGCRPRHLLVACLAAAGVALALDGWIDPLARRARAEQHWANVGRNDPYAEHPTVYATTIGLLRRAADADVQIANDALYGLGQQAALVVASLAMGLLGTTLGHARAAAGAAATMPVMAFWWAFAWIAYRLLEYWSVFFAAAIGVRGPLSTWLPPLGLICVAALFSIPRCRLLLLRLVDVRRGPEKLLR